MSANSNAGASGSLSQAMTSPRPTSAERKNTTRSTRRPTLVNNTFTGRRPMDTMAYPALTTPRATARAAYPVPATKRASGPIPAAADAPTKCSPATDDSSDFDRAG